MHRIMIIGSGGAGKSTLARKLGELLNIPVIHLDAYFWQPNWVQTPLEPWEKMQRGWVEQEKWIMDGNYGKTLDLRLERADQIIFLDFPRRITLYRVLKRRMMNHGKTRPDMGKGCPEQIDFEFIKWVWQFPKKNKPIILKKLENLSPSKIIHLKSPQEVEKFLHDLKSE